MGNKKNNIKCYNAGKISGLSYLTARYKFEKFDKTIKDMGMIPVNPMEDGLKANRPWWMHLLYDLSLLLRCECVLFHPDWEDSKGAKIEFKIAKMLGKKIILTV